MSPIGLPPIRDAVTALRDLARVAQLVEHATENRSVGGSTPSPGTIFPPDRLRRSSIRVCDLGRLFIDLVPVVSKSGHALSEYRPFGIVFAGVPGR